MASPKSGEKTARRISAEEAAGLVQSGMWVDYGFGMGQPDVFDKALAARKTGLHDVKIRACLTVRPRAVLETDPEGTVFGMLNWHFGGYDREQHDKGRVNYIPMNFGEAPDMYRRFIDRVDVAPARTAEKPRRPATIAQLFRGPAARCRNRRRGSFVAFKVRTVIARIGEMVGLEW
jgi:acyl-CoA hydrolase